MTLSNRIGAPLFAALLWLALPGHAQNPSQPRPQRPTLADSIATLSIPAQGHVGTFLLDLESGDSCLTNGADHFPMLSVFKFPLALYVLDQVDKGKLSLETPIDIRKSDWRNLRSPLLAKYPQKHLTLTVREVLAATASSSDNAGCDLLLKLIGGPSVLNAYVHRLGVTDINIAVTEMQMNTDWDAQYQNWCKPAVMGQLLHLFYVGRVLSPANTTLLLQWMVESTSPASRIKGLLPAGTIVAHKTGTSDTNKAGLTPATNDVGIITLPNGHHLIIVVFVADAKADMATRDRTIATIAQAGFDYYGARPQTPR